MATLALVQGRIAFNTDGRTPGYVDSFAEAASQSFLAGYPVMRDATGGIVVWVDASEEILGFAEEDASGTTGTMIKVRVIRPGDVLVMNLYHATAASAVSALTDCGTWYNHQALACLATRAAFLPSLLALSTRTRNGEWKKGTGSESPTRLGFQATLGLSTARSRSPFSTRCLSSLFASPLFHGARLGSSRMHCIQSYDRGPKMFKLCV